MLGPLVASKLIQPLNHSYIPNIGQAWPDFTNPFYDQGWQYTVPYTIYTTGIAWRKDLVDLNPYTLRNPWKEMFFQPKYKGKIAILDDYRESPSLALMMNGIYDLNTTSKAQIDLARQTLQDLDSAVNLIIDNNDYTEVPNGQTWIHHAWSGDMAAAASYMPKGVNVDVVGYWFPKRRQGPDRQRHEHGAPLGVEPGARASVPQQPDGRGRGAGQHQLERLHAAADRGHPGAAGRRSRSCPRA